MAKAVADNPGFVALRDSVQRIDPMPAERLDS
jgi:hypothetical protein